MQLGVGSVGSRGRDEKRLFFGWQVVELQEGLRRLSKIGNERERVLRHIGQVKVVLALSSVGPK